MAKQGLTWKIFLLIVLTDVGECLGQYFMKIGLNQTGIDAIHLSNILEFLSRNVTSPWLWLGIFFYVSTFSTWILVLTRVDLSIAVPVGSTSYIFIPLVAMFFLNESVSPLRWLGILFIIVGIHIISKSGQKTVLIGDHV